MAIANGFKTGDVIQVEQRVISAVEAADKQLTLDNLPDPDKILLDIPSGTSQVKGFDFEVVGQVVTWDGYALETVLDVGDNLRFLYVKK